MLIRNKTANVNMLFYKYVHKKTTYKNFVSGL